MDRRSKGTSHTYGWLPIMNKEGGTRTALCMDHAIQQVRSGFRLRFLACHFDFPRYESKPLDMKGKGIPNPLSLYIVGAATTEKWARVGALRDLHNQPMPSQQMAFTTKREIDRGAKTDRVVEAGLLSQHSFGNQPGSYGGVKGTRSAAFLFVACVKIFC